MGFSVPGRPPQPTNITLSTSFSSEPSTATAAPMFFPQVSSVSLSSPSLGVGVRQVPVTQLQPSAPGDHGIVHSSDRIQPWQSQEINLKARENDSCERDAASSLKELNTLADSLLPEIPKPAQPLLKPSTLDNTCFILP